MFSTLVTDVTPSPTAGGNETMNPFAVLGPSSTAKVVVFGSAFLLGALVPLLYRTISKRVRDFCCAVVNGRFNVVCLSSPTWMLEVKASVCITMRTSVYRPKTNKPPVSVVFALLYFLDRSTHSMFACHPKQQQFLHIKPARFCYGGNAEASTSSPLVEVYFTLTSQHVDGFNGKQFVTSSKHIQNDRIASQPCNCCKNGPLTSSK